MGVNFTAKGLPYEDEYDCGYITFGGYRKKLALALQPDYGLAYWAWYGGNGYEDDGERIISGDGAVEGGRSGDKRVRAGENRVLRR